MDDGPVLLVGSGQCWAQGTLSGAFELVLQFRSLAELVALRQGLRKRRK